MQVDIRVPVGRPIPHVADFIARCEDAGFDGVGVHDHPHSGRDVYMTLALAAARTRRLRLYPATSSPIARHPLLLASVAHSLDEVAPGRAWLTVAPGFLAVRNIGKPRATVATMRDAVLTLRRLLAGDTVTFGPNPTRLRNRSAAPTPVLVLAAGPRMMELAGEVADGVLMMVGLDPKGIGAARAHVEAGARRAGRSLEGFRWVFIVTIAIDESVDAAAGWVRRHFAPGQPFLAYPSASNLVWLRQSGFDLPDDHDPAAIPPGDAVRIADAFGLFGPPERCAERLRRARDEAGVDHVFLFPAHTLEGGYDMPEREVDAFARVMRPRLA
jgi:5,10-methylenetetrahydromethanopterin reductase